MEKCLREGIMELLDKSYDPTGGSCLDAMCGALAYASGLVEVLYPEATYCEVYGIVRSAVNEFFNIGGGR